VQAQDKPNIVIIWGDDIGISNLSTYSEGLMGNPASGAADMPSHAVAPGARPMLTSASL
jgi:arylsulfatase A-like enzyme